MNRKVLNHFVAAGILLAAFLIFTVLVQRIDVQLIGPNGSSVGFAALNGWFHAQTGVHWTLYTLTDWLELISLSIAFCFGIMGLVQLIRRRSLRKVDASILILGRFYLLVIAAYVLFNVCVANYRPVLIESILEASYPSSTTVLVLCVHATAMMQLRDRMPCRAMRMPVSAVLSALTAFMVLARVMSGVHWLTDIIGGILLSAALIRFYRAAVLLIGRK